MPPSAPANQDQATRWNAHSGQTWSALADMLDRVLAPVGAALIDALGPLGGKVLLDIGCGPGATTFAAAQRAAPDGHCLGVDISAPLLETARGRAAAQGIANAQFLLADAQTHDFAPAGVDTILSRFGVMFFADPVAAFANLRRAARPDALLRCIAWRSAAENRFMTTAEDIAATLLPDFPVRDEDAPGQFAFGKQDRVATILGQSGWHDIAIEPIDIACRIEADDFRTYVTRMGPLGVVYAALDPAEQQRIGDAVEAGFAPYIRDGAAHFTAACWMIGARA